MFVCVVVVVVVRVIFFPSKHRNFVVKHSVYPRVLTSDLAWKLLFANLKYCKRVRCYIFVILFRFHNIILAVDRKEKSIRHMFKCVAKNIVTNTMRLDFSKFYLYTYPGLSSISLCVALNKYVGFVGGLMQICIARVYLTDYSLAVSARKLWRTCSTVNPNQWRDFHPAVQLFDWQVSWFGSVQ